MTAQDGTPWFNAVDVCRVLDLKNPSQTLRDNVDKEDLRITETLTSGGKQKVNFVNESGLYALILGSKLPTAKRKRADELTQTCGRINPNVRTN